MSDVAMRATTAATALMAKASVKPFSAGKRPPRITWPASIAAATCAPIEPPMERMIVLMPVATPVWSWRTASTTRLAIAAKARPMPMPTRRAPKAISASVSWKSASST